MAMISVINNNTSKRWKCASCTFNNVWQSSQCSMCGNHDIKCAECSIKICKNDYDSHLLAHQLQNSSTNVVSSPNNLNIAESWQQRTQNSKSTFLAGLFDGPSFTFKGSWQDAKTRALIENKYILLNIQDPHNFVSHCLNRDLWKEKDVENAIKKSFIFYQCVKSSDDGRKLIDLYALLTMPCIIAIPPNNAQQKHRFSVPVDPQNVLDIKLEIFQFLEKNDAIKCVYCDLQISSAEYNSHLTAHEMQNDDSKETLIPCESCSQQIQISKFNAHTAHCQNKNENNLTYFRCTQRGCTAQFLLQTEYDDHILVHKLSEPEPPQKAMTALIYIICPQCKAKIAETEYLSHELVHKLSSPEPKKSSDPLIKCEYPSCNKQVLFSQLQAHRLCHENKEQQAPLQCEYKGCTQMVPFNEIQRHQLEHQRQDTANELAIMQLRFEEMQDKLQQEVEEKKQALISVKETEELNEKIQQQQRNIDQLKENAAKQVEEYKQELAKKSGGVEYPKWWNVDIENVKHGEVKLLELDLSTSVEAKSVIQLLKKTASNQQVTKIEYVVNRILFDEWYNGKKILSAAIGENKVNERLLFHGTRTETVMYDEVVKEGFKKVFNKGYSYGMGTYFARDASYSVGYASNVNGVRKMFCCKVICGESVQGNSGILLTSWPKKANGLIYDSLVDNVGSPSVFVIHKNSRIYPMFIISFK